MFITLDVESTNTTVPFPILLIHHYEKVKDKSEIQNTKKEVFSNLYVYRFFVCMYIFIKHLKNKKLITPQKVKNDSNM